MRRRDVRKIFLTGFFWAASAMAGENTPAVSDVGAISSVRIGVIEVSKDVIQVTSSDNGTAPIQQRKINEPLFPRKKKAAQTPAPMLDEKNLGLGCAKP